MKEKQLFNIVNGWGVNVKVWEHIVNSLAKDFVVQVIDPVLFAQDNSLDHLVANLLRDQAKPAIWLGWSFGGLVATKIAAKFPQKVLSLAEDLLNQPEKKQHIQMQIQEIIDKNESILKSFFQKYGIS